MRLHGRFAFAVHVKHRFRLLYRNKNNIDWNCGNFQVSIEAFRIANIIVLIIPTDEQH